MQKLEKASENPDLIPEMEAEVNAGSGSGLLAGTAVPSWAEWALGAVGAKFYKSAAAPKAAESPAAKENSKPNTNEVEPPIKPANSAKPINPVAKPAPAANLAPKRVEVEGWGDLEDDDEEAWGSMEPAQPSREPSKSAVPANKSAAAAVGGSGGWGDDDADADADWGDMNDFGGSGGSAAASSSSKFGVKIQDDSDDLFGETTKVSPYFSEKNKKY